MTNRHQLEAHRHSIADIRGIMNAMKNLAYMETRKLDRFLHAQESVVKNIESVAADFLSAYPGILPDIPATEQVYLLVGSERGFCGDFNDAVLHRLLQAQQPDVGKAVLIVIGRKLHSLLETDTRVDACLDGASMAEEVASVLTAAVSTLATLQARHRALTLKVLYHAADARDVISETLLPPFQSQARQLPTFGCQPCLNLAPGDFLIELADHYLFAVLQRIFYVSLMAESQRRVQHLEGALSHLDDKAVDLRRRSNAARQEEIVEEIEVMLLSTAMNGFKKR